MIADFFTLLRPQNHSNSNSANITVFFAGSNKIWTNSIRTCNRISIFLTPIFPLCQCKISSGYAEQHCKSYRLELLKFQAVFGKQEFFYAHCHITFFICSRFHTAFNYDNFFKGIVCFIKRACFLHPFFTRRYFIG